MSVESTVCASDSIIPFIRLTDPSIKTLFTAFKIGAEPPVPFSAVIWSESATFSICRMLCKATGSTSVVGSNANEVEGELV